MRITERITEEPIQKGSMQVFRVGEVLVIARGYKTYSYGDMVQIEGKVQRMVGSERVEVLSFLQPKFMLIYPQISVVSETAGGGLAWGGVGLRLLSRMREGIIQTYQETLPEPHAGLLAGIVVGVRQSLPEAFHEQLRRLGLLHIVVASGMNITILGGAITAGLLRVLSRRRAVAGAILGIMIYAGIAGLTAPVVRAAIMGTVAYLGMILGRERDKLTTLMMAAAAMLVWDPRYLGDIGWQLSFGATAGIVGLQASIKRVVRWDELAVTLAATVTTAPLIWYYFGTIAWISPLANVLVAPVVPVIMIGGGVLGLAGMISPGLGQAAAWLVWPWLEYFVRIVNLL